MTIDERARHRLHERLDQVLGPDEAAILMEHLPPVGWADVATKRDLDQLEARMEARMEANLHRLEARLLRAMLYTNSVSVVTVGALAFAAAKLV
jgi:hypothetical protein